MTASALPAAVEGKLFFRGGRGERGGKCVKFKFTLRGKLWDFRRFLLYTFLNIF